MPRAIFKHDQFLGERQGVWHAPGFAVSRLLPTVPEDGVIEHAHAEAHFVLLLDGTYVSSAHGAPCEAREPVLIYNPPGTVHRDRFRGDGGAFMTVAVSLVSQRCCEEVMTLPDYACVVGDGARPMALAMAGALARAETVDELALESQCLELMSETALHYRPVQERAPAWLRRARECLREADLPGGLADVARACGVHPVYLARAFRAHYGCSPGGFRRRCRLNQAATMLVSSTRELSEVAQACGFFDQAHFTRAFAEAFGMTPGRYRLAHRPSFMRAGSVRTRPEPG
ncbi:MAG TPA: AraC family transcriptional regulator [Rhodanobacter sp.]